MGVEAIGGWLSGSLSLISDSAHMFTDLFTLGLSFFAINLSAKPADFQKTYGYYRAEVLGAFLNSILLIGVSGLIFYDAIGRFRNPIPIESGLMFWVALFGLLINLVSMGLLHGRSHQSINLKAAYLHVLSDALGSIGVVVSAAIIHWSGWNVIDSILSLWIGGLVLYWAIRLFLDSIHILMESTPKHIQIAELIETLTQQIEGIQEMHDVHVWEITSDMYAMTAHITVTEMTVSDTMKVTERVNLLVSERYHIEHVNLQYECVSQKEGI